MLRNSFLKQNKGFSLVEVLIALLVFLVGLMGIIRVFPGGFAALTTSQNATLAHRLAQAQVERLQARSSNLPWAIVAMDTAGNPDPTADPTNVDSALTFRRVINESTLIPAPDAQGNSVYTVLFGPVDTTVYPGYPGNTYLYVFSGQMSSCSLSVNPINLLLNQYEIDYSTSQPTIYLDSSSSDAQYSLGQSFKVTYQYWSSSTNGQPVLSTQTDYLTPKLDAKNNVYAQLSLSNTGPGAVQFVQGSEDVRRGFTLLGPSDTFDANPYEYKIADSTSTANPGMAAAGLGVIEFNPLGYGYQETTATGKQPLAAYIDYTVLDWSILLEERKIPDGITSATDPRLGVKVTIPFLKQAGVTQLFNSDQTYGGLTISGLSSAGISVPCSVLAVDMDGGAVYSDTYIDPTTGTPLFVVDWKTGTLTFEPASSGHSYRIYYQADGDWSVEPFKAYYIFNDGGTPPTTIDYTQYYADWNNSATPRQLTPESGGQWVYVPRCYANTSVTVDYTYQSVGTGTVLTNFRETGRVFQVPQSTMTGSLCGINLVDQLPSDAVVTNISQVYGTSINLQVAWHSTGRGFTAGTWHTVTLQNFLSVN
jgi:prepilin-type N-terminal cleavage/methylation domain-containing protein